MNLKAVFFCAVVTMMVSVATAAFAQSSDPLPSWNYGAAKEAIVQFVKEVTTVGGSKFLLSAKRIAVFDNDGTLWAEQPMYFQFEFVFDRVKALAPMHPEWKQKQPFKAVLEGDLPPKSGPAFMLVFRPKTLDVYRFFGIMNHGPLSSPTDARNALRA